MNRFVRQTIDELLNRENILSRVRRLENLTGAIPSARIGSLGELSAATGDLVVVGSITVYDPATGTATVVIDSNAIKIVNVNSASDPFFDFYDASGIIRGGIFTSTLGNLEMVAFGYATDAAHRKLILRAQHDAGAVNIATIEIISNFADSGVDWITLNADKINIAGDVLLNGEPLVKYKQSVYAEETAYGNSTDAIPFDDTIPQVTEGKQILSVSITPSSTDSIIRVTAQFAGCSNPNLSSMFAVFETSTTDPSAELFGSYTSAAADGYGFTTASADLAPGVTTALTYTMRVGCNSGDTTYYNGRSAGRLFGGISRCWLKAEEIST